MKKIKIYTIPDCHFCEAAKKFLKENKIKFEEINVLGNKEKAKEMIIKSKQKKVPVLDFGYGKLIIRTNENTKDLISKIRKKLNGK